MFMIPFAQWQLSGKFQQTDPYIATENFLSNRSNYDTPGQSFMYLFLPKNHSPRHHRRPVELRVVQLFEEWNQHFLPSILRFPADNRTSDFKHLPLGYLHLLRTDPQTNDQAEETSAAHRRTDEGQGHLSGEKAKLHYQTTQQPHEFVSEIRTPSKTSTRLHLKYEKISEYSSESSSPIADGLGIPKI